LDSHLKELDKTYIIEKEQLGTGGAIKKACEAVRGQEIVIVNGDTIFNISLPDLLFAHHSLNADCTIALKELINFDRYGTAGFNKNGIITAFHEKKFCNRGFINGGIYILNVNRFLQKKLPEKFSFEKDYLETYIGEHRFMSTVFDNYFIDIGVPEDYQAFQQKYLDSPAVNRQSSSGDNLGIIIETIGAFFDLLD
jgi:D-glycero-alpha-D-manno-heptose 1-phosphate guanylyltransferase